jgi:OOP family OmpA-OmpF porin
MKNTVLAALCAASAAIASGPAWAEAEAGSGLYASLSVGPSRFNIDCTGASTCDRSSVGGRLLLGYRVLPYLAVEASYAELGKSSATVDLDGDVVTAELKGRALGIGVAGLFPFGTDWTGIARAGVASTRAKAAASGLGASAEASETHATPYVGLGLDYAFTPNVLAGVAWDSNKLKFGDTSSRVNTFSVVGTYRF